MSLPAGNQPPVRDPAAAGSSAERRRRHQRRAARRLDVLVGVVAGVIWLLLAPGVAIAGIIAALVLLVAGASFLYGRTRGSRRRHAHRRWRRVLRR